MEEHPREGGDITATDMVLPEIESEIVKFYKDSTIFLTGGTGFLGKLCMEKLLRICPDLKKIYILVRPKKGKDIHKRFEELFEEPSFEPLKRKLPNFMQKVEMVSGDVGLPGLGLSDEDKEKLIADVDCIFHFAATVRFDEKLRIACNINVRGVREVLSLAKKIKQLRALVHVSTAYSNCVHSTIDEKFYDPPISGDKLINLVESLDDETLDAITPTLLKDFPNTYTYTKCIAEDIVKTEGHNLPVAVFRPSIVIATVKEPVAGWINCLYGATGVFVGVGIGIIRVLRIVEDAVSDLVPADYVVNSCVAVAWDISTIKTLNENKEIQDKESREEKFDKEIPVYNFVSQTESPLTWKDYRKLLEKHGPQIPSEKCVWHYMLISVQSKFMFNVLFFLLQTIPAYIVDLVLVCIGKKPMLIKGYQKIYQYCKILDYFMTNRWKFLNNNTQALWQRLNSYDQELFEFSMKLLNWEMYFHTYVRGARVYILKDPLETIPKGAVKYNRLQFAHYTLIIVLLFLLLQFAMFTFRLIF